MKHDILNIPISKIGEVTAKLGLKSYASSQMLKWLYQKRVKNFEEMTNLSKDARTTLNEHYYIGQLKVAQELEDKDGTRKFAFELEDGLKIESVLIPMADDKMTLCISTQVGCAMGCGFCRTASLGLARDLTQSEIVGQVLIVQDMLESGATEGLKAADLPPPAPPCKGGENICRLSNIVLMGMGEPLANLKNVAEAIRIFNDSKGPNIGKRRITLSTCGLIPQMAKLAELDLGVKLAISLNATTDEVRSKLMPINKKYPIAKLMDACRKFVDKTGRYRITFEYVMCKGINDSIEDARRLVQLISHIPAKINLIPVNAFQKCGFDNPSSETIEKFADYLRAKHVQVNIRASHGQDILAACGQLAAK